METGVFVGLGYYQLNGESIEDGLSESHNSLGLTVGVTGDLPLNRKRNLALRVELQGHWADVEAASLFAMAQSRHLLSVLDQFVEFVFLE